MRKSLVILAAAAASSPVLAQVSPALGAGDIAIIGRVNDATVDSFAFVTLADVLAGTTVYFTDNGWTGTAFRGASATDGDGNENLIKWTAGANIAAGTIVSSLSAGFTSAGSIPGATSGAFAALSLSQTGDQITAFQGPASIPLFNPATALYVLDDTSGFEAATSSATGSFASGLVPGVTAVTLGLTPLSGTLSLKGSVLAGPAKSKTDWLTAFNTASNWTAGASASLTLPTGSIAVLPVPEPGTYALLTAGLLVVGAAARRKA